MNFDEIRIGMENLDLNKKIRIAVANIPLSDLNVEASYLRRPVVSRSRLKPFSSLLNEISAYRDFNGDKIDLVIFPEVSIPHIWEPMIVAWARRHNIGIIAGLEHRINGEGEAINEVLAALPYRMESGHVACMPVKRVKKFYSPEEKFILENEYLKVPNSKNVPLHLFRWRGASFSIYNCFELTSIECRGIFKGRVDFIVATEFNKDVNYFSNIMEAASRDIHCYIVQVNDSCFGDSRVISPSRTELMNPLRIKGGDNLTFLTMILDLESLRIHQRKDYGLQKDSILFKPTPPGFDKKLVEERFKFGVVDGK
ncbi:hypothetical protein [Duganella aceris]|uniref:CN hydrolase domain-containing protein n=1 Tax=Duganella aceris TaxID=2703883 RepID=A0ABX0FGZ4_9BURK|nr:hypothetical protein [Duganella aceris]NGZ83816.1 hypothetical protein [Duganella aceris]